MKSASENSPIIATINFKMIEKRNVKLHNTKSDCDVFRDVIINKINLKVCFKSTAALDSTMDTHITNTGSCLQSNVNTYMKTEKNHLFLNIR